MDLRVNLDVWELTCLLSLFGFHSTITVRVIVVLEDKYLCASSLCDHSLSHVLGETGPNGDPGNRHERGRRPPTSSSGCGPKFWWAKEFVADMAARTLSLDARGLSCFIFQYSDGLRQRVEVPFTAGGEDVEVGQAVTRYLHRATNLPVALKFLTSILQRDVRSRS